MYICICIFKYTCVHVQKYKHIYPLAHTHPVATYLLLMGVTRLANFIQKRPTHTQKRTNFRQKRPTHTQKTAIHTFKKRVVIC